MKIDANEYKFPPGGAGGDGCVGWNYNFVSKRERGYFQEFLPGEFDKFEISRGGPDLPPLPPRIDPCMNNF